MKLAITNGVTLLDHSDLVTIFDDIKVRKQPSRYDVLIGRGFETLAGRRGSIRREGLSVSDPLCYNDVSCLMTKSASTSN